MKRAMNVWGRMSLIRQIVVGVLLGVVLSTILPQLSVIGLLGDLFVGGLKAIAPLLVFALVANALSQTRQGQKTNMRMVIFLYLLGTFSAAFVAVLSHYIFPVRLVLPEAGLTDVTPPQGVGEVFQGLLLKIVDNPINALSTGNYIGVLSWAVIFGFAMRSVSPETKHLLNTIAEVTSKVVKGIINLAPFGIMGLVFQTIVSNGVGIVTDYSILLLTLVCCMVFIALVVNPLIAFIVMRANPYPLVLRCLRESGVTAFFTRSSAANIPVNMRLCEKLGLDKDTYTVSIPLGATINMAGAAVTITVLTMAAVSTLNIKVDFASALILSIVAALSACGASGVAGGSLLLIPVACSLFGIPSDIAMQVVGVGFIVGVIQDSCETALNSSTDVLFTAVAERSAWKK